MSSAASAMAYRIRLQSRREVADRTQGLQFDRPASFSFKAGVFVQMTLVDATETDALGNARAFSIASAPHEDGLMFATRLRDSAFKRTLAAMTAGTVVRIDGPFGDLVLHNDPQRPAVLLAGGIGITPFQSIALRAAREKLPHPIFLFYSKRRPTDAPFLEELRGLEATNPNYRFATMREPQVARRSTEASDCGLLGKSIRALTTRTSRLSQSVRRAWPMSCRDQALLAAPRKD